MDEETNQLTHMAAALAVVNEQIAIVVRVSQAVPYQELRSAIDVVQKRHTYLQMALLDHGDLQAHSEPLPLTQTSAPWSEAVEHALNSILSTHLMAVTLVEEETGCSIVVNLHHSISDARSCLYIIHELLMCLAGQPLPEAKPDFPSIEHRIPAPYKGLRGVPKMLRFAGRNMLDEVQFRVRSRHLPPSTVPTDETNFVINQRIKAEVINKVIRVARQHRVTLNATIGAAFLLAYNTYWYKDQAQSLRTFAFKDMRSVLEPPLKDEELGSAMMLLRYTVDVSGDLWNTASYLTTAIDTSIKRGEHFLFFQQILPMIKAMMRYMPMRIGHVAFNYVPMQGLDAQYGDYKIHELHGYVRNLSTGPYLTAQGRLWQGDMLMNYVFLQADISRSRAQELVDHIEYLLVSATDQPGSS